MESKHISGVLNNVNHKIINISNINPCVGKYKTACGKIQYQWKTPSDFLLSLSPKGMTDLSKINLWTALVLDTYITITKNRTDLTTKHVEIDMSEGCQRLTAGMNVVATLQALVLRFGMLL